MGRPKKKRASRVKLVKVIKLEPDRHVVELEIDGLPLPEDKPLSVPVDIIAPDTVPVSKTWLQWLKSIW